MTKLYATCDANGPISKRLETLVDQETIVTHGREWIDNCQTDAEDDLGFCGEGMDEDEFAEQMESAGYHCVDESDIAGDWKMWEECL